MWERWGPLRARAWPLFQNWLKLFPQHYTAKLCDHASFKIFLGTSGIFSIFSLENQQIITEIDKICPKVALVHTTSSLTYINIQKKFQMVWWKLCYTSLICLLLGTIKRGYPNQSNKNTKGKASPPGSPRRGPQPIYSLSLEPKTRLARPHWPRARVPSRPTPQGSDADTVSPDPLGLGRKFRLARPVEGSGAKRHSTGSG